MENKILNEDCRKTLERMSKVDYVFTVPPDFNELNLTPLKENLEYYNFLDEVFKELVRISSVITIAITDRKYKSRIISKHSAIIHKFSLLGYNLISHKIWKKSNKINLYRLNYTHIMTFSNQSPKQNHPKIYEYDIYEHPEEKYEGYPYGIPIKIVKILIKNFTKENDTIYDPFSGSGTTAVAAKLNNRKYIGSEINGEYFKLSNKRLKEMLTFEV